MLLGYCLRWGSLHNCLNLALGVEPFKVVALEQSHQLPQSDQIVKHDHLILPLPQLLCVFYSLIEGDDISGELFLEGRQRLGGLADVPKVFGVLCDVLFNDLIDFIVIGGLPVILPILRADIPQSVDFLQFVKDETSHQSLQLYKLHVYILA